MCTHMYAIVYVQPTRKSKRKKNVKPRVETPKVKTPKGKSNAKRRKEKPMDRVTGTSSPASPAVDSEFDLPAVLKSFANPRNDIFMRSLKGELAKRPQLIDLKPADGDEDPPEVLFGNHRKGYFKARHLCRVWTLQTLKWLRTRGEFFVVWKEGDEVYDGRRVLAHAFTIKYISLHQPGIWMMYR